MIYLYKVVIMMKEIINKICPVCGKEISIYNRSNAKFNDDYICNKCIRIINKHRGGEKESKNIKLEYLQKIVKEDKKYTIIASIIILAILIGIVMFIISIFNKPEEKCQTTEECWEESYHKIWSESEN